MDTIHSVLSLITSNCYMGKIDIKDAYYSVPILEEHQKFLKFMFKGKLYQFTFLPNGLCSGPRKFTKLLKPPLATLRKSKISVSAYIDDLITVAKNFSCYFTNIIKCVNLLDSLGFVVHPDKSVFVPSQTIEYFGFIINSVDMTVTLTNTKKENIMQLCISILADEQPLIRSVAQLLGKFTSSFPAVLFGPLLYRRLERDKILSLKLHKGKFDRPVKLSRYAKLDICWWRDNVECSFSLINKGNPEFTLTTDASKTGGFFSSEEASYHINVLEIKSVLFDLQSICNKLHNVHIKLLIDNTTAVHTINNMGSCRSKECDNAVCEVWDWAINRNIWLSASHIPGILNTEADAESRRTETQSEWKLNVNVFHNLIDHSPFYPEVDFFASRINTQLPIFYSYRPDPQASIINAFSVNWNEIHLYCFPPFSCVGKVIQKVIFDEATGILVVPHWPNQPWFTTLIDILVADPFVIPPSVNQLILPNQPFTNHPLAKNLELMACLISGKNLVDGIITLLIKSWSSGTCNQYSLHINRWMIFCVENNVDPVKANVRMGAEFLTQYFYQTTVDYSSRKTARSALFTIIEPTNGVTFGNHPLIKRLLKEIFKERPTFPRYAVTYDVNKVFCT